MLNIIIAIAVFGTVAFLAKVIHSTCAVFDNDVIENVVIEF